MADDEATVEGVPAPGRSTRSARSRTVKGEATAKAPAKKAAPGGAPAPTRARTARSPGAAPRTAETRAGRAASRKAPEAPVAKAPRKAPARKAASPEAPAANAPAGKTAKRAPAAPRGAVLAGGTAKKAAGSRRAGMPSRPPSRLAAEQIFDDDVPAPEPQAPPEDPHARIRGILRAAALEVEARSAASTTSYRTPAPAPMPPPVSVDRTEEPVTGVPTAPGPVPPVDAEVDEDELEEDRQQGVVDDDWAPPEVMDAETREMAPARSPSPAPPRPAVPPADPAPPVSDPLDTMEEVSPPRAAAAPIRKRGAGISVLAIVLALVIPLVGAILGFLLANRARRDDKPLAGLARIVSIAALVLWLIGGGVGLVALGGQQGVDYSKLKVGDCFNSSSSNEVRGVKVVPCSKRHDSEIFFLVTHPAKKGDPYPGRDPLVQFAADSCLGQPLTDYLGIPLEQSKLKDFEIVPQSSAWKDGRRVLVCGVDTAGQGRIKGSVKGTGR